MKQLLFVTILMCAFSTSVFAKSTVSTNKISSKKVSERKNLGIKLGLATGLAPALITTFSNPSGEFVAHSDGSLRTQSLKVSYDLPIKNVQKLSFTPALVYTNVRTEDLGGEKVYHIRAEGNASYLLRNDVSIFGGINLGKWYGDSDYLNVTESNLGLQGGASLRLTNRVQATVQYTALSSSGSGNFITEDNSSVLLSYDVQVRALEVGVSVDI